MKKVYLIYAKIPSLLFDSKMHLFVHDKSLYQLQNNHYIGLYAWTKNRILLDAFLEFREGAKKIYNIIEREFTKEEYKEFRSVHIDEELFYYNFPTFNHYDSQYAEEGYKPKKKDSKEDKESFFSPKSGIQIVSTKQEYDDIFDYGEQYFLDYLSMVIRAEYSIFKPEYIDSLDKLGYCDIFNIVHNDEEDEFYFERAQATEYNNSFNMTMYGNSKIDLFTNKAYLFINIFYEMIVGFDPNKEIKFISYYD